MPDPDSPTTHAEATSRAARPSIRTVADLERDFSEHERTPTDQLGELLGGFIGSFPFLVLQILVLAAWLLINLGLVPGLAPFDKPPFNLLTFLVGVESIFLLIFVLMRENRMRRQEEQRAQLELQVNLLADNKASEILKALQRISEELGVEEVAGDKQVQQLSHKTHLKTLERELKENMPKKQ